MKHTEDLSEYNKPGTPLRDAQIRMKEILEEIIRICQKHQIPYWVDYGTLLGTVRHQGFIPWDDDIDVSLFEQDYKRLIPILEKELPDCLCLQSRDTDNYFPYSFVKVVDKWSCVEQDTVWNGFSEHKGVWVDIFPMQRGKGGLRKIIEALYGRCYRHVRHFDDCRVTRVMAYLLYPFALLFLGIGRLAFRMMSKEDYVAAFGVGNVSVYNRTRQRSDTLPTREMFFEGIKVAVPNNFERVLTQLYGNYMQLPPKNNRKIHIISFKRIN